MIEAVIGIMYVATMIARFVSIQIGSERRDGEPGLAEQAQSPNHGPEVKAASLETLKDK